MFSKEDILAQLRKGVDASNIAQNMADEINAALQEFEEEQSKAAKEKEKREDAGRVLDALQVYYTKYVSDDGPLSAKEREEGINLIIELCDNFGRLTNLADIAAKVEQKPLKLDLDDDVLRKFLATL